jgi:hypothetical protein
MDASEVSRAPQGWRESGAFNFPELWWTTQRYRATDLPITPAIFMAICFEETACCNLQQGDTPVAAGPGQLQVSDDDKVMFFAGAQDRENFMGGRWDSSQTTWAADTNNKVFKRQKPTFPDLQPLTMDFILSNNPFSVQMHLKYFQWLMNGYGRSGKPVSGLGGLLLAQTGGGKNAKAGALFVQGGEKIETVMKNGLPYSKRKDLSRKEIGDYIVKRRAEFAAAITFARVEFKGKDANGVAIGGVPLSLFGSFWKFFLPDPFLEDPEGYLLCGF